MDTDGLILLPNATEIQQYVYLKKTNPNLKILLTLTPNNRIMSDIVTDKILKIQA